MIVCGMGAGGLITRIAYLSKPILFPIISAKIIHVCVERF